MTSDVNRAGCSAERDIEQVILFWLLFYRILFNASVVAQLDSWK